jgi:hypothetical protein
VSYTSAVQAVNQEMPFLCGFSGSLYIYAFLLNSTFRGNDVAIHSKIGAEI